MCREIFVIGRNGASWQPAENGQGSHEWAKENIAEYLRHIEDEPRDLEAYWRHGELVDQIDLTLMKIGNVPAESEGTIVSDRLNLIWSLNYEEQRFLLKKMGIPLKRMGLPKQKK